MRMLAMNSLMEDAERRRQAPSPLSDASDDDGDDVNELDPVDGFPSPPTRSRGRRRFVKPGLTTYELSFSRRHALARRRRGGYKESEENKAPPSEEVREAPAVSSLSSVLNEVMTGKSKALSNIEDTTAPQQTVTYVIEHAADGTPYVAASDGKKYFEDSAIGQIFLKPAKHVPDHNAQKGRRSDLDFLQTGGWQQNRRSDFVGGPIAEHPDEGKKSILGFKGFQFKKKKGSASDLNVLARHEEHADMAVLGSAENVADNVMLPTEDTELPMLDPDHVDRSRGDSSWEVPAVAPVAQKPELHKATMVELVDVENEGETHTVHTVKLGGSDSIDSTASAGSRASGASSASSASSTSTSSGNAPLKTLPRLQPKKDLPAPPLPFDAYDEDDNPLCRSFQNVRDVDLIRTKSDDEEEDDEEHEEHDAAAADDDLPDVNSPDFAGRVRVSSGATSVAEFVGGFKGQLSRRSGTSGLINRKRAVRHARLTAAEQKAAELARRIREARNRVPLEFRDEYMSLAAQNELQKKKKLRARGRHVRFNPDVQCREFEVESEDEDDGYDSPDEIVDAVQLVSKRDVVHAEDVVAAFPMEQLELPEEGVEASPRDSDSPTPPSLLDLSTADHESGEQNDPLTFSQLKNDKRLSFSDL